MICSISGEVATDPVVSPKSGAIFERKHIENYISTSGTDPINDEPLSVDELVSIKSSSSGIVPPQAPSATSIPSLLATFQNEWDALALEVFTLRKQLYKAREELSAALYHHDAAVRVAANAIKERDEAKAALQQLAISIGNGEALAADVPATNGNGKAESSNSGSTSTSVHEIPVEEINHAREELFQLHKSQKPTLSIKPDQSISIEYVDSQGQPFKKATGSHLEGSSKNLIVGSSTGAVAKFNFENLEDSQPTKFTASKTSVTAVNQVHLGDELLPIIAYKSKLVIDHNKKTFKNNHGGAILQIIVHPKLSNLFFTLGEDNTWALHDTNKEEDSSSLLYQSPQNESTLTTGAIHVDGALLAIGNLSGKVQVFSTTTAEEISVIDVAYANVDKIVFALNGYWLFVSSSEKNKSRIDVVDLRKNTKVHSIEFDNRLLDFIVDPSSSLVITLDSDNTLALHRYIKKGKQWNNNLVVKSAEDSPKLKNIHLLTDADDESFKTASEIRFVGVGENSSVSEYKLTYS
ncbi:Prp19/Pso4-like-domain-containing protein [Scheffersomyces xylosifermentans]|uniref:Prp19/Pso4-like-domain-containing protein n=1 Tax=Scheffersomyces xylosifermentans TaxID=1304137 RepID=UPI00315C880B